MHLQPTAVILCSFLGSLAMPLLRLYTISQRILVDSHHQIRLGLRNPGDGYCQAVIHTFRVGGCCSTHTYPFDEPLRSAMFPQVRSRPSRAWTIATTDTTLTMEQAHVAPATYAGIARTKTGQPERHGLSRGNMMKTNGSCLAAVDHLDRRDSLPHRRRAT